jgi:hypothetical protein
MLATLSPKVDIATSWKPDNFNLFLTTLLGMF